MKFTPLYLKDAYLIETEPRKDERGSFERTFCMNEFQQHGLAHHMVQSNLSKSEHTHTLRGMHYQINDSAEVKLVRCIRGKVLDVIIDIRPSSQTYCKHFSVELTDNNNLMLYVPAGFAHGFMTLEDNCEVFYQVSNFYNADNERGIRWNDQLFGINWPSLQPVISDKDANHPDYKHVK